MFRSKKNIESSTFKLQTNYKLLAAMCLLLLAGILSANASDVESEFKRATDLYQRQNYDSASKIYEQIVAQDYRSAELFYNLGNCYYKKNDIARAVLNYERALKLKPDDEDIHFNLKVTQLKVVDKIETVPEIFYVKWLKSLSTMMTVDGWSRFVIACVWLMFFFAAVYIISSRSSMRRLGFILAAFFLILGTIAWTLSKQTYTDRVAHKSAVVMSVSAYVKSSPGENNTDLFLLHEGTKVAVIDEYENWVKIRIANGSEGWLKSTELEQI